MLTFESVIYSNFLAVGNTPISIDLNRHTTTMVSGPNGSGKTTILEAIVYALFGKPYRKVKLAGLINSVNKKKMLVELDFSTGGHSYKVVRGEKPKKFEIYKDDELIEKPAKGYQDILENIIGFDYNLFTQTVILNKSRFTPFLSLSAPERRKIVEDILDIEIYSIMGGLAKAKLAELKATLDDLRHKKDLSQRDIDNVKYVVDNLKKQIAAKKEQQQRNFDAMDRYHAQVAEWEKKMESHEAAEAEARAAYDQRLADIEEKYQADLKAHEEAEKAREAEHKGHIQKAEEDQQRQIAALQEKIDDATTVVAKSEVKRLALEEELVEEVGTLEDLTSWMAEGKTLAARNKQIEGELEKLNAGDCSVCGQEIHEDFRAENVSKLEAEKGLNSQKMAKLQSDYVSLKKVLEDNGEIRKTISGIDEDVREAQFKIKQLDEDLERTSQPLPAMPFSPSQPPQKPAQAMEYQPLPEPQKPSEPVLQDVSDGSEDLEDQMDEKNAELEALAEQLSTQSFDLGECVDDIQCMEAVIKSLADDGIKARVVRNFIPAMNKYLNKYLMELEFFVGIELDETFGEKFTTPNRDGFVYYNLSDGQKTRVDLALLLTWLKVAESKNSVRTNLLFLDEIVEALDTNGVQLFLNLIRENMGDKNTFVITQRNEEFRDYFRSELNFALVDGFTQVAA